MDALPDDIEELREAARLGDSERISRLFERYRSRLTRMLSLRMDHALRSRLDPSDVIQEAYLECWQRLDEYLRNPSLPFYLWMRLITGQRLLIEFRRHLGAKRRDLRQEVPLREAVSESSSFALAEAFAAKGPSPSKAALKAELQARLKAALDEMAPLDREIVALRHFEELTNRDAARALEITPAAASQRYFRAINRLRAVMDSVGHGTG